MNDRPIDPIRSFGTSFTDVRDALYKGDLLLHSVRRSKKPWVAEAIFIAGIPFGLAWLAGEAAEHFFGVTTLRPYTDFAHSIWSSVIYIWGAVLLFRIGVWLWRRKRSDSDTGTP